MQAVFMLSPVPYGPTCESVQAYNDLEHYETPFVVKMHRFTPLSAPQPVFSFHHPTQGRRARTTPAASASCSPATACLRRCAMAWLATLTPCCKFPICLLTDSQYIPSEELSPARRCVPIAGIIRAVALL